MKRAFSTLCCLSYNIEEIFRLAKEANMPGVELRLDMERIRAWHEKEEVYAAIRKWPEQGLTVTDVAASISVLRYDETVIEDAKLCIDVAQGIGAAAVRVFAGAHRKRFSDCVVNDWEEIARCLREIVRYAQERKIEIWLETHSDLSAAAQARKILDLVAAPDLKILWDVMHSVEFHETLEESLDALQGCLAHVHWKDGKPAEDTDLCEYIHTDLGAGKMVLDDLLRRLKQRGYDGYVSLEWESPWRPEIRDLYPDPLGLLRKYNHLMDEAEGKIV